VIRLYCWNNIFIPKINEVSALHYWSDAIYYPTYTRIDGLLVGVSIAALNQYLPRVFDKISKYGNPLILMGISVLTSVYLFFSEKAAFSTSIFGFPLIAIGYGLIVLGAISPTSFLYKWNSKATTFIATLSYAIYLSHKGVIHIGQQIFSNWGIDRSSNLMLLICLILCVVGAWVLHLTIEKPFMKLRRKIINRNKTYANMTFVKHYTSLKIDR
jgi:peptidoglycan/LPS O-acetylase OafA/YrhL